MMKRSIDGKTVTQSTPQEIELRPGDLVIRAGQTELRSLSTPSSGNVWINCNGEYKEISESQLVEFEKKFAKPRILVPAVRYDQFPVDMAYEQLPHVREGFAWVKNGDFWSEITQEENSARRIQRRKLQPSSGVPKREKSVFENKVMNRPNDTGLFNKYVKHCQETGKFQSIQRDENGGLHRIMKNRTHN